MVDIFDAQKIVKAAGSVLFGKNDRIELAVVAFLSGGHLLIEDVPGVGKTTLAKAIAVSVKGSFSRIQFTSDMLPLDITGFSVINKDSQELVFQKGPLFADFVLADEINRASPKTQSALLEAMSEKQITIDSSTYRLPDHFMVIATQNTHDNYGTYHLPESQLDRFAMRIDLGYAEPEIEKKIIINTQSGFHNPDVPQVLFSNDDIKSLKDIVDAVHIDESVLNYI
ncbi:MAG: AAA family ATPase, partial [Deltaproteobacteria bacterium]|nr:AAA family ATPase [Deltaproteobacteria bacterium]